MHVTLWCAALNRQRIPTIVALLVLNPAPRAVNSQTGPRDDSAQLQALQQEITQSVRRRYESNDWGIPTDSALADDSLTLQRWTASIASIERAGIPDAKLAASYRTTESFIAAAVDARACREELWNVDPLYGIQAQMAIVFATQPLGTNSARAAMLAGGARIPQSIRRLLRSLDAGLARGFSAPQSAVHRVIAQIDDMRASDGEALLEPMRRDTAATFRPVWTAIVQDSLLPALRQYRDYLAQSYLPRARSEAGLGALPDGVLCYGARLAQSAGTHPNRDSLYDQAVARRLQLTGEIRAAGEQLFKRQMTAVEVLSTIRGAPAFVMRDADSVLGAYRADLGRARDALPRLFSRVPDAPLVVRAIPRAQAATQAPARYEPAPDDASQPSVFLVNAYQPGGIARMNIMMGVVHEAYPGHHFQRLYAHLDPSSAGTPAFGDNGAYIEGWGIYAERLGDELGLFNSALTRLGYLTHQLDVFMALQLDIGMHARGWTRSQVVDSMMVVAGRPRVQAESYADRHAASPGQLASYGIGYLAISQARDDAERRLGTAFDIKRFHDVVLSDGNVTLPDLAERVDAWVRAQSRR